MLKKIILATAILSISTVSLVAAAGIPCPTDAQCTTKDPNSCFVGQGWGRLPIGPNSVDPDIKYPFINAAYMPLGASAGNATCSYFVAQNQMPLTFAKADLVNTKPAVGNDWKPTFLPGQLFCVSAAPFACPFVPKS